MKKDNIKTPSRGVLLKNIKKSRISSRINKIVKNPFGQFFFLGLVLVLVYSMVVIGVLPPSLAKPLATVVIFAIVAVGFCLLLGYSGLASLGTAGFAGIGIYVTNFVLTELKLSFMSSLLLSIGVALIVGLFVGLISLRIEGMYLAILTLGLSEILTQVFKLIKQTVIISKNNITFFSIKLNDFSIFIIIVIVLLFLLCITNNLINSPTGRAMLAMKNSTSAAQAMGISLIRIRLLAFVISTIYASIGGMLYILVMRAETMDNPKIIALAFSLNILGAVIVGGSKSLWGTLFGTVIVFGVYNLFLQYIDFFMKNSTLVGIVTGVLLVIIVMFYPGGLTQLFYEIKNKIKKIRMKRRVKKYGAY